MKSSIRCRMQKKSVPTKSLVPMWTISKEGLGHLTASCDSNLGTSLYWAPPRPFHRTWGQSTSWGEEWLIIESPTIQTSPRINEAGTMKNYHTNPMCIPVCFSVIVCLFVLFVCLCVCLFVCLFVCFVCFFRTYPPCCLVCWLLIC